VRRSAPPRFRASIAALILLALAVTHPAGAYSVFTHQQIVDLAWDASIKPALLARFPRTTPEQLVEAHAFAYGGAAIQDAGYYPFGHEFFSDLTHYVRSGDFVLSLLRNSRTVNEYAFAIGALSHYLGDNIGHQDAVNPATGLEFPKLARQYGAAVTYDQSPHSHVRTEFAFDINALSKHRFAPGAYLRIVGMGVPRGLLERAFAETYGLPLHEVLGDELPALRSYRSSVRSFLPHVAAAEVVIHRNHFPTDLPTPAFEQYQRDVMRVEAAHHWERYRRKKPPFTIDVLAFVIRILPKVGALSDLAIRGPSQFTQNWYVESVNLTVTAYRGLLSQLTQDPQRQLELPNRDLDTGYPVAPGAYPLTDDTYAKLLHQLTARKRKAVPQRVRENILSFYSDLNAPFATKRNERAWAHVLADLTALQMPTR
jgi:Zinc dependent phospholipase C